MGEVVVMTPGDLKCVLQMLPRTFNVAEIEDAFRVGRLTLGVALVKAAFAVGNESGRRAVHAEVAADQLRGLMSEISEDCHCAGWLIGTGYALWGIVEHEQGPAWGHG